VLVVPVPDADPGSPVQRMPRVEATAENSVGGGEEGDREVEGPVECAGPHGRWEMQPGGAGQPLHNRCGEVGASGGGRCRERDVRAGSAGVAGGAGRGGRGVGRGVITFVPTHT